MCPPHKNTSNINPTLTTAPSPNPQPAYVRHPLYSGLLLASLGLAGATHSEERLALAVALALVLEAKIKFEEGFLVERYGAAYEDYRGRVKKLIPFVY